MFDNDLENYLRYKQECDGVTIPPDDVNFEDFMHFLDIEHFLGLRGSDTWSREGNEGTVVVKTLIGHILSELTPAPEDIPRIYLTFANGLQPGDYVLTFNYDVLLERALEAVGKPYRLFPNRYRSVQEYTAIIDNSEEEAAVLKLHGSIDWFDRTEYAERERQQRAAGLSTLPPHPVFAHARELGVTKLLDGPRHADDPLNQMYRVHRVESLYRKPTMFLATPWLLAPSTVKILYAEKLKDFWYGLENAGVLNFGLSIIGYSLPAQDDYARQVIYRVVTNYQKAHWDEEVFGLRKPPLVIVARCDNAKAVDECKAQYRFVDWSRAILCRDGLNEESVNLALGQP